MENMVAPNGVWRLAILDRGEDSKIILASVTLAEDVEPVQLTDGGYYNFRDLAAWATQRAGEPVELLPLWRPMVWSLLPATRRPQ